MSDPVDAILAVECPKCLRAPGRTCFEFEPYIGGEQAFHASRIRTALTPKPGPRELTCVGLVGGGRSALSEAVIAAGAEPGPPCERCGGSKVVKDWAPLGVLVPHEVPCPDCTRSPATGTGMLPGQRCTAYKHPDEMPHSHDERLARKWEEAGAYTEDARRCPYIAPATPGKGGTP